MKTKQEFFERRGTMIYMEDARKGKAKLICICENIEQAQYIVDKCCSYKEVALVFDALLFKTKHKA